MAAVTSVTLHYARLAFTSSRRNVYEVHRDLCRAFDSEREGAYLFRCDIDRRTRPAHLVALVQSVQAVDWTRIGDRLSNAQTRAHEWRLQNGSRYRFFLRANTTRAKKATLVELAGADAAAFRATRGKRVGIRGEAALNGWLLRQAEHHGFRVVQTPFAQEAGPPLGVPALRIIEGRDADWTAKGTRGRHAGADFEGLLDVADSEAFASALRNGIGPAKAFGFGMLSLAPA